MRHQAMPDQTPSSFRRALGFLLALAVLALVFGLYLNPDLMVDLGTRLISCL